MWQHVKKTWQLWLYHVILKQKLYSSNVPSGLRYYKVLTNSTTWAIKSLKNTTVEVLSWSQTGRTLIGPYAPIMSRANCFCGWCDIFLQTDTKTKKRKEKVSTRCVSTAKPLCTTDICRNVRGRNGWVCFSFRRLFVLSLRGRSLWQLMLLELDLGQSSAIVGIYNCSSYPRTWTEKLYKGHMTMSYIYIYKIPVLGSGH